MGKVINSKSKLPIADASITVYDPFGDSKAVVKTDADGKYKVTLPCSKKYRFVASKLNHSSDEKPVETKDKDGDEIPDVNFELSNYADLVKVDNGQEKSS
ncbi:carboxypeptidase regulatory-like domain-containing protein [Flavobacterium sp. 3HN19-14]|uniref:carboxypeptidase regulatory-like domain-containing protein n=1 Tax=Flavobacterium sp. 3HN19-14 TaxID=3448133 RepID=UPI003EE0F638